MTSESEVQIPKAVPWACNCWLGVYQGCKCLKHRPTSSELVRWNNKGSCKNKQNRWELVQEADGFLLYCQDGRASLPGTQKNICSVCKQPRLATGSCSECMHYNELQFSEKLRFSPSQLCWTAASQCGTPEIPSKTQGPSGLAAQVTQCVMKPAISSDENNVPTSE